VSSIEPFRIEDALKDLEWMMAMREDLNNFKRNEVWTLVLGLKQNVVWYQVGISTTKRMNMVW
jgi:hypothetical protein